VVSPPRRPPTLLADGSATVRALARLELHAGRDGVLVATSAG
jgi:hypothetical protein